MIYWKSKGTYRHLQLNFKRRVRSKWEINFAFPLTGTKGWWNQKKPGIVRIWVELQLRALLKRVGIWQPQISKYILQIRKTAAYSQSSGCCRIHTGIPPLSHVYYFWTLLLFNPLSATERRSQDIQKSTEHTSKVRVVSWSKPGPHYWMHGGALGGQ